MKILNKLFFIALLTANISILQAQDLQGFDYRLVQALGIEITEESKDAAYSATSSALVGTWIDSSGMQMVLNANGTGTLYEPFDMSVVNQVYGILRYPNGSKGYSEAWYLRSVFENLISDTKNEYGITLLWTQPFTWSKKGIHFNVKFSVKGKVSALNNEVYKNLSPRRKEGLNENIAKMNKGMEIIPTPEPYNIDYLDKNVLILTEYHGQMVYVKKSYLPTLLTEGEKAIKEREAEAKAKAEEEAKVKAEAEAKVKAEAEDKAKEDGTYPYLSNEVDEVATFMGGSNALNKWLSNNIRYPEAAQQNDIKGRVVVKALINKDGSIEKTEIERKVDRDLDREAIRVVSKMPKWNPAKKDGKDVSSWVSIPVIFNLN